MYKIVELRTPVAVCPHENGDPAFWKIATLRTVLLKRWESCMAEGQAAIQVFFTNDGLGVGVVSGVVRVTESESEQSEHFRFFRLRLRLGR